MGWIIINIILPVILPPIGIVFLKAIMPTASMASRYGNFSVIALVKDGQLGWASAGMCAAAFYDLIDAAHKWRLVDKDMPLNYWGILFPLVFSTAGAVLVAILGAAYNTPILNKSDATRKEWFEHYRTLAVSMGVTVTSAVNLMIIHFAMVP